MGLSFSCSSCLFESLYTSFQNQFLYIFVIFHLGWKLKSSGWGAHKWYWHQLLFSISSCSSKWQCFSFVWFFSFHFDVILCQQPKSSDGLHAFSVLDVSVELFWNILFTLLIATHTVPKQWEPKDPHNETPTSNSTLLLSNEVSVDHPSLLPYTSSRSMSLPSPSLMIQMPSSSPPSSSGQQQGSDEMMATNSNSWRMPMKGLRMSSVEIPDTNEKSSASPSPCPSPVSIV